MSGGQWLRVKGYVEFSLPDMELSLASRFASKFFNQTLRTFRRAQLGRPGDLQLGVVAQRLILKEGQEETVQPLRRLHELLPSMHS